MARLENVRREIRPRVGRDSLASELADALFGMFTIEHHRHFRATGYTSLHCKPTRTVAESLLVEREVLAIIANFDDVQVRTVHVAKAGIDKSRGRLDPALVIVLHADRRGDESCEPGGVSKA